MEENWRQGEEEAWRRGDARVAKGGGRITIVSMHIDRVTVDPLTMSGKPCIRGLRITVANVLRQLANRRTREQILASYPDLEPQDIDACLDYAALRVDDEELALSAA